MRQRYLIVKNYEVLAICDGLNNVKQYIENSYEQINIL
jgi:hypothetical protein